jgi:hypothetical protein
MMIAKICFFNQIVSQRADMLTIDDIVTEIIFGIEDNGI